MPSGYFDSGADMRTAAGIMIAIVMAACLFSCSSKSREEQKALLEDNKNLALKFLHGVQNGDKNKMFEAANLTTEIVNDSREKLIHPAKYKQTDQQKMGSEHALRVSGNIDFIAAKIKPMLPKSAAFQITQAGSKELPEGGRKTDYSIEITYGSKEETISDKNGKSIKVLELPFIQVSRPVNGRWINDFSFDTLEFEKIAVRDFKVITYF